ncbi:MAG TPA: DUF5668 domain-containing protein [Terriglobales bacterium]|nr:DUF5668 domain-containing protein [Terriglobales bacterium]
MNCAIHSDTAAVAYCRTCGKGLCAACRRDVRGVIYCEECLASRIYDTMPPNVAAAGPAQPAAANLPSPALAAVLGFIPGVGAMYNGQFAKALIHVLIFATLCWGADHAGPAEVFFGLGIPFWIFYMVFDAYKTAQSRRTGEPVPDPFGLNRMWAPDAPAPAPRPAATAAAAPGTPADLGQGNAAQVNAAPPEVAPAYPHAPVGAIILIGLGIVFLLNTMGLWPWHYVGRMWPLVLIIVGVWTWMKRRPVQG